MGLRLYMVAVSYPKAASNVHSCMLTARAGRSVADPTAVKQATCCPCQSHWRQTHQYGTNRICSRFKKALLPRTVALGVLSRRYMNMMGGPFIPATTTAAATATVTAKPVVTAVPT